MGIDELESSRREVRAITLAIMELVKKRLELVNEIGNIKHKYNLDIIDTHAEEELRNSVIKFSNDIGLDKRIALRLLNVLLDESRRLQAKGVRDNVTPTHILTRAKELEQKGKEIIHLEVGEPDLEPPSNIRDALNNVINNKRYRYTEPAGIRELRKAIADKFDTDYKNVIITPGGRFGVYLAIALLNEGEDLIIIDPSWPAYKDCARLKNINVKSIRTELDNNWEVNIEELKNAINENTKMIILNYPNNPTGKILDNKTLDNIINIARESNLIILSDEVYSYYSFKDFKSVKEYEDINYIIISSFSKAYSMTGFRVGFAISNNQEIINKMIKHQSIALTCVPEPMQYAALKALDNDHRYYSNIIKERIEFLSNKLSKMPVSFYKPDGGMYIFARVNKENFDSLKFAYNMLDHGLGITPGIAFGNYNDYIRISACAEINKLDLGLKILEESII